ncbi:Oxygen-insensitive NAD(P)H nitroreductase [Pseudovibrio axinellae]|uniref:Oxygen-insensitive NAD(P)H nitroreductase n=1 Tax=Pseudovibrio axinellae TaxID=989403 RepID=A0A165T5U0_9HYPH|nr:oxygen-insensitive NAD(P)H nitroreductase [Pseudovibrio axinellae]KZL05477.1 Oxygen-insensitive NAD(P)H nitroreductase [Pseudovibrio axinellae]SEP97615.1 dihydropteridine reductase [Pseudovibrio axinellae]
MNVKDVALSRYSTKAFDPTKRVSAEQFDHIKSLLRFSPSSVNTQPWHFIIADTQGGRERVSKGTQGMFAFNNAKVLNSSHVIVFCVKTEISDEYLTRILEAEENDKRFTDPAVKETVKAGRSKFVGIHRDELKDADHWMEKQVYLNMGTVLLGAGALGIDAVPIEGVDAQALNEEFGLIEKGYRAVALIALGYRHEDDFNAALPKSRLPEDEIITQLA